MPRLLPILAVLMLTVTALPAAVVAVEPCCDEEGAEEGEDEGCAGGFAVCACCTTLRVVAVERDGVGSAPEDAVAWAPVAPRDPPAGAIREVLHVPKPALG